MIIEIRNMMYKKSFYKIFLWAFLLMFIGGGLGVNFFFKDKSSNMITVYGHSASREKYVKALRNTERQKEYYKANGIDLGGDAKKETVQMFVQNFLEREVLDQLGVEADEFYLQKTLNDHLSHLPKYFFDEKGRLNEEMFKKHLLVDLNDLYEDVKQMAEREVINGILDVSHYVAQFEVNAQYNKEYAGKTVEVLIISPSAYASKVKENKVSEKDLAAFYKKLAGKERFKTKEQRSGQYWVFDKDSYNVTVSDAEVEKKYNKDKASKYLETPAEVQVRQIFLKSSDSNNDEVREKVKALQKELTEEPDKFAETAKKISEDEKYAAQGGLLPFFSKDSKAFNDIIVKKSFESLSKDGQISEAFKIDGGYVILQRIARKKTKYKPLASLQAEIKKDLLKTKYQDNFMRAAKRMTSQVKYNPELLPAFVTKHNGQKHTLSLSGLESGNMNSIQLFRTDADRYQVYFDDKNNGVVLKCTEIVPSKLKDLEQVRGELEELYYDAEAKALLQNDVDAIMDQAANKSLESIAQNYKGEYKKGKSSFKNGQRSNDDALNLPAIQAKLELLQYPGDVVEVVMAHGTAILKLDQLEGRDEELFAAKKDDMRQTLLFADKYKKRESFIASLGRNAIIKNEIEIKKEL